MTRYHRLARETPDFRHWRLPVATVVGTALYAAISLLLAFVAVIVALASGEELDDWLTRAGSSIALDDPLVLAFQLITIAALTPCVLGSIALIWRVHARFVHSVEGRVRWGWLGRCLVIAFAVVAISLGLAVVIAAALDSESFAPALPDGRGWAVLAVILLLVPFQAAAEEYVFRGGLLQLIGSWTRWTAIPVLVCSLLFAAGHLYDVWGLLSVFVFGVIAALVTIRTGGLEAAIGLHVANNAVLMSLDVVGVVDASGEGAGLLNEVVPSTLMCLAYWALVEGASRRRSIRRTRAPLPVVVAPPPPYVPGTAAPHGGMPLPEPQPLVHPDAPPYPGDPAGWPQRPPGPPES